MEGERRTEAITREHLTEALSCSDDEAVNYHIRQALQHLVES